jgi:hypothetical protein
MHNTSTSRKNLQRIDEITTQAEKEVEKVIESEYNKRINLKYGTDPMAKVSFKQLLIEYNQTYIDANGVTLKGYELEKITDKINAFLKAAKQTDPSGELCRQLNKLWDLSLSTYENLVANIRTDTGYLKRSSDELIYYGRIKVSKK